MLTERTVDIPEGVTASMEGSNFVVSGPKGTLRRGMRYPGIVVTCDGSVFSVSTESSRKKILAMLGTYASHARNMCTGVTSGFEYRMKVVYNHFPIQLKQTTEALEIANFLGEKESRFARIPEGVDVKIAGDEVIVSGTDKEVVGTTAGRIERATKVRHRDPRVFQDGIYIIEKA